MINPKSAISVHAFVMDEKGEVVSPETLLKGIEDQLEELDAREFDLPEVSAPSLDSILNDSSEEDGVDPLEEESEFGRLLGTFDTESLSSFDDPERKRKRKIYEGHGSVMRHTILKGVSTQMVSAQTRSHSGFPSAMAVDQMIAIGTTHGVVFIFEPSQVLKWGLGTTKTGDQYGSVSSLCFNVDSTRLLVGYAKGQITMWDLMNGKLLRTITDAHPLGQAVLHVKFTDSLTVALCSDSGGSVFDLEFTRNIAGRGCVSRCLFSGSRGEVCTIEPLHTPNFAKTNANSTSMLVAMATFTKVLVLNVRPEVKIVFSYPLSGEPDCLPLVSWRFAGIRVPGQHSLYDPVLATARQSTFHFFQAIIRTNKDIYLQKLQTSEVPYKVISFCWLNSATVVAMDTVENLHVVDVKTWDELEVIDISNMQLVYGTSFFKSLATGGNVSPALSFAGDQACYYSLHSYKSQVFLLGNKSIHALTVRSWLERLEVLLKEDRYQDALALALSFYDDTAKAVIGLPRDENKRNEIVSEKMLEILYTYVDLSMTKLCPEFGKIDELIKHYENVVPICVEYCLRLDRVDVLFGRLYERFSQDVIAHGAFLECLEPFILDDSLKTVSPQIIKNLTNHFLSKDMLSRVEACIVHLDIISLDIHETVKLCRENGMYDAIIYIYNHGLQDYVTPLQDLVGELRQALNSGKQLSDNHVTLGNKLLVYISNSLAGLAYPRGSLPDHTANLVKTTIFKTLTSLKLFDSTNDDKIYPYLRTFLDFDTREFLNVLAMAFEDEHFGGDASYNQRQVIVDILLQVMIQGSGYTPKQKGMLYTFLARQIARHYSQINLNRSLFEQVIEHLCKPGDDSHKEERQEALLEMLFVEDKLHINMDQLLSLAEHANLFRVCEYIYKKRHLHDKILLTYIDDPSRCHQAFTFIKSTLNDTQSVSLRQKIRQVTLNSLEQLVACDASKTAQLLMDILKVDLLQTVYSLDGKPETQYLLLKEITSLSESNDSHRLPSTIYDVYIERMCKYDNYGVEIYLRSSNSYLPESVYEICSKNHMYDSMSYLLEKMGKVQKAFDMMLKTFKEKIELFLEQVSNKQTAKNRTNITIVGQQIESLLLKLIGLCQRNSSKLSSEERESIWFPLLDSVVEPQQKISRDSEFIDLFKEASKQVMNCMMGNVELPSMMAKIIGDFNFSKGKFGDVKDLLMGMLDTYNYEKTLLGTVCNMLDHDLVGLLGDSKTLSSRAFVPISDTCGFCHKDVSLHSGSSELHIFRCGHMFHESCLIKSGSYMEEFDQSGQVFACYICDKPQYMRRASQSRLKSGQSTVNLVTAQTSSLQKFDDLLSKAKMKRRSVYNRKSDSERLRLTPPPLIDNDLLLDDT